MNQIVIVVTILFAQYLLAPFAVNSQPSNTLKNDTSCRVGEVHKNHSFNHTAIIAIENASIGGAAGVIIGQQMDRQAEELKQIVKGGNLERIAEGMLITLPSQDLFAPDSYEVLPATRARFKNLARIINKFPLVCLLIEVHTDNVGEEIYNQSLSEKRAKALENFMLKEGINSNRLLSRGYGNKQPLSDNATEQGRNANRRVEVVVIASTEMKALARKAESEEFLAVK